MAKCKALTGLVVKGLNKVSMSKTEVGDI